MPLNAVSVDIVRAQRMQEHALVGGHRRVVWKMEGECQVVDWGVVMGGPDVNAIF